MVVRYIVSSDCRHSLTALETIARVPRGRLGQYLKAQNGYKMLPEQRSSDSPVPAT